MPPPSRSLPNTARKLNHRSITFELSTETSLAVFGTISQQARRLASARGMYPPDGRLRNRAMHSYNDTDPTFRMDPRADLGMLTRTTWWCTRPSENLLLPPLWVQTTVRLSRQPPQSQSPLPRWMNICRHQVLRLRIRQ
jgi:hypothetical protein